VIRGTAAGSALLVAEDGGAHPIDGFPEEWIAETKTAALAALSALQSRLQLFAPGGVEHEIFLEVLPRRPTLLLIGAVHVAAELARFAKPLGYRIVVADGRESFLDRERFPDAHELLLAWPAEAFQQVEINGATCICVLSHDPKFDEPALELALRSPAGYIGAIGSKKTQAERRERLKGAGFTDADLARIHGPIGLDIGGREPAEIALAILAEITAVRYGKA
jgi:xanthine dehydrogenase accessory factor